MSLERRHWLADEDQNLQYVIRKVRGGESSRFARRRLDRFSSFGIAFRLRLSSTVSTAQLKIKVEAGSVCVYSAHANGTSVHLCDRTGRAAG